MSDITKCVNDKCKVRNQCYRHIVEAKEYDQSYFIINDKVSSKDECAYFVDNK